MTKSSGFDFKPSGHGLLPAVKDSVSFETTSKELKSTLLHEKVRWRCEINYIVDLCKSDKSYKLFPTERWKSLKSAEERLFSRNNSDNQFGNKLSNTALS